MFDGAWPKVSEIVPFALLATQTNGIKLSVARLIETLLIAGFTALLLNYVSISKIEVQLSYIEASVKELKADFREHTKQGATP